MSRIILDVWLFGFFKKNPIVLIYIKINPLTTWLEGFTWWTLPKSLCLLSQVMKGQRGIRTPGGFHLNCFQDNRLKPLGHLSKLHKKRFLFDDFKITIYLVVSYVLLFDFVFMETSRRTILTFSTNPSIRLVTQNTSILFWFRHIRHDSIIP